MPPPVFVLSAEDDVEDEVKDWLRGEKRADSFGDVHDGDGGTSASLDRTSHLSLTASMRLGAEGVGGRSFALPSS